MSRPLTYFLGWLMIAGAMLMLAPMLLIRTSIRLWRLLELYVVFHGDAAAQEKARWHAR